MIRLMFPDGRGGMRAATVPAWAVWLGAAGALALGLLVFTIGLGLLLLLAPVAFVGGLIARWRIKHAFRDAEAMRQARPPADRQGSVIEADYRVIDGPPPRP